MTAGDGRAQARATIGNPMGLHARPAVKLTKLAKQFEAEITVRTEDGEPINAKSPNRVMKLKAREGARLVFEADGADAEAAVAGLVDLVERNFEE